MGFGGIKHFHGDMVVQHSHERPLLSTTQHSAMQCNAVQCNGGSDNCCINMSNNDRRWPVDPLGGEGHVEAAASVWSAWRRRMRGHRMTGGPEAGRGT